jgi:transposase, IS5 family
MHRVHDNPLHAYHLSGEAAIARGVENPYYQHFTGEVFF